MFLENTSTSRFVTFELLSEAEKPFIRWVRIWALVNEPGKFGLGVGGGGVGAVGPFSTRVSNIYSCSEFTSN